MTDDDQTKEPATLVEWPPMSDDMRQRVNHILTTGRCWDNCDGNVLRFVKRTNRSGIGIVQLQCLTCGQSRGGNLKRSDLQDWERLPEWDEDIRTRRSEERAANVRDIHEFFAEKEAERKELDRQRRAEYHRWLLHSVEWKMLRRRVLKRAEYLCEACLVNRATDVHHVTYELGKLPPAWQLRAICRECHERIHDWQGQSEP